MVLKIPAVTESAWMPAVTDALCRGQWKRQRRLVDVILYSGKRLHADNNISDLWGKEGDTMTEPERTTDALCMYMLACTGLGCVVAW